ncbi:uncharacterized protein LOC117117359 [Anneissia japonica]|uniref:uncharacterized protein LOC117117359 n=1 Tax=Anneissia japonica TaxID=1529436 RepID=UPI00142552A5|nr:uncharacterized protein LOC117117359 [Anneissia japonica]
MQRWVQIILVVAWKIAIVGAQRSSEFDCPEFAPWCYMIYPTNNDGWKYKDPRGVIYDGNEYVYESPNCYKFLRVYEDECVSSCANAQLLCEEEGGNITVIDSIDEYEQLTYNVLHALSVGQKSTFSVHVQNPLLNNISMGCATIMIGDGYTSNTINIYSDNTTTGIVNSIVCESMGKWLVEESDVITRIFPAPTTIKFTNPLTETKSEMKEGANLWIVGVITSSVVVTIAIILLSLLLIRRRQRRTTSGNGKPVAKVYYHQYVAKDVHDASHKIVGLNRNTTANDVTFENHESAVGVEYHDTAVPHIYHDIGGEGVYQNSDVGRSKRTGNQK